MQSSICLGPHLDDQGRTSALFNTNTVGGTPVTLEGGPLNVVWWNDFHGQAGDSFNLFDFNGELAGRFGSPHVRTRRRPPICITPYACPPVN